MPLPLAHGGKHVSSKPLPETTILLHEGDQSPRLLHQFKCLAIGSTPTLNRKGSATPSTPSSNLDVDMHMHMHTVDPLHAAGTDYSNPAANAFNGNRTDNADQSHDNSLISLTTTLLISIYQLGGADANGDANHDTATNHAAATATATTNTNHTSQNARNTRNTLMACINVQVAPTAEPFSARYRESLHRVELQPTTEALLRLPPTAIIATKYIICTVASQLVIFQLCKPKQTSVLPKMPPLPSYVTKLKIFKPIIPVATKPRCVANLTGVRSVCNLPVDTSKHSKSSLLLAGLDNGDIVAVTYHDACLVGTLWHAATSMDQSHTQTTTTSAAVRMAHVSMGKRGRLVCLSPEGDVSFFESHALVGPETELDDLSIETSDDDDDDMDDESYPDESETSQIQEPTFSKPIPGLLRVPSSRTNMAHIHLAPLSQIHHRGSYTAMAWIDSHFLVLLEKPASAHPVAQVVLVRETSLQTVSTLTMTEERLAEISQQTFARDLDQRSDPIDSFHVTHDSQSSCILLSTHLHITDRKMSPLLCCWHWRSNTTSLVILSSIARASKLSESSPSMLALGKGLNGASKLTTICSTGRGWQKTMYQTALLSPNSTLSNSVAVQQECPLLFGPDFVMFPVGFQSCSIRRTDLEWRCANIPTSYLASCGGPPVLASIATQDCRSIAISSLLGLCILDASTYSSSASHPQRSLGNTVAPKWKLFDKMKESHFQVLAMQWWENKDHEDLLLTIIETSDCRRHLACWSRKRLDANHQMLRSIDGPKGYSSWGIVLPATFIPNSMSISPSGRKSVLLITDCAGTMILFQLQRILGEDPMVNVSLALHGELNPGIENVFIASASHDFDLDNADRIIQHDDHVGVIGMICHSRLVAAVVTRGSVVSEVTVVQGTVSKLMLSEVAGESNSWSIELYDGSIWCWATPASVKASPKSEMPLDPPFQIGKGCYSNFLGTLSRVGDSSMWMLGSPATQSQFVVGALPSSNHGCTLKVGQEGMNYSRGSIGDDAEPTHEVFSMGKASIATPAFLPALLNQLLIQSTDSEGSNDSMSCAMHNLQVKSSGDTAMVVLRLLVLRSIELVTTMSKKKVASKQAISLFTRVIDLLGKALPPNQFASLLLSLARQVEPSCMEHLFPLPITSTPFQTVEDLYLECVQRGSLATPAATLPLLATKLSSLEECKDILYHCLLKLSSTSVEPSELPFDACREERQLVRDLFRFANQLEQMDESEFWSDSKLDVHIMPTAEEKRHGVTIAIPTMTPEKKQRSGFGFFSPLICSGRRRREERAVYEAASTFIGSGFEEFEYSNVDIPSSQVTGPVSVTYITGKLLVRLSLEEKYGWKKSAVIARLVLGDNAIDESGKGVLNWFQRMPLSSLAATAHRLSRSTEYLDLSDGDEMADVVTNFLVHGMFAANHEITRADAAWLLELLVLSLSRLSPKDAIISPSLAPGLTLMVTIVGHVSGRMEDMVQDLERKNTNLLMMCYEEAKRLANSY